MEDKKLYGSICLSDIPAELKKKVMTKGGEKEYVSIVLGKRKNVARFGKITFTHYISLNVRKSDKREGVNYFIGDLGFYESDDRVGEQHVGGSRFDAGRDKSFDVVSPLGGASLEVTGTKIDNSGDLDDLPF